MPVLADVEIEGEAEQVLDGPPIDQFGGEVCRERRNDDPPLRPRLDPDRPLIVRLALSFALLIVGLLVLGWWVSNRVTRAELEVETVLRQRPEKLRLAHRALGYSNENTRIALELLYQKDPSAELLARRLYNTQQVADTIASLEKLCDSRQEKELLAAVKQTRVRYMDVRQRAFDLLLNQHHGALAREVMLQQVTPARTAYHAAWEEFANFELQAMLRAAQETSARNLATRSIGLTLQSLSALFAAFIAVFTTRQMAKDLCLRARMQAKLTKLNGHLERRVAERTAELARAEQRLRDSLAQVQEYAAEIEAVNELAKLLQSCLTLEEARQQAARVLKKFFPAGSVLLLNSSRNLLEVGLSWGESSSREGPFPAESCWGLRKGEVHVTGPHCTNPICSHCDHRPRGCHVCIPMIAQGSPLGTLSIADDNFCGGDRSSPTFARKMKLAITLGEQISLAFANLMLRETLNYQSVRDPLTGLFNRRHMEEILERELQRAARKATPVTLLMIDIDHFKRFNDLYGHEAGDLVLREVGLLLRQQVRGGDVACRYGGEEFLLIMSETETRAACERAESLRQRLAALPLNYRGQPLHKIAISIGVASFPVHGGSAAQLVSSADGALYRAKREGRDRVLVAE